MNFDKQITLIKKHWKVVCDEAQMTAVDKIMLWKHSFLNPYAIQTK